MLTHVIGERERDRVMRQRPLPGETNGSYKVYSEPSGKLTL